MQPSLHLPGSSWSRKPLSLPTRSHEKLQRMLRCSSLPCLLLSPLPADLGRMDCSELKLHWSKGRSCDRPCVHAASKAVGRQMLDMCRMV